MTVPPKRRDDQQEASNPMRVKVEGAPNPERDTNVEGFCTYQVKLHQKFDHWPKTLRITIQKQFKEFLMQAANFLRSGSNKRPKQTHTFQVIKGSRVRSSTAGFECERLLNHAHLCDANKIALEMFTEAFDVPSDCDFVELETSPGDVNNLCIHLHSGRNGDVSWGFDTDGCLSLYLAEKVTDKRFLSETVYYVERRNIEDEVVEIED